MVRDVTVVCAYCNKVKHQGTDSGPVSHGICEKCAEEQNRILDQLKKEREAK